VTPLLSRGALPVAAVALLLLVNGCNRDKPQPVCPRGVIPADASNLTRFRDGPGRDLTDVVVQFEIQDILVQCSYEKKAVNVDLQIAVTAARGPADRSRVADVDYWVAIVDPQQNIMTKEPFKVHFEFTENRTRLGTVEQIAPRLPLSDLSTAPSYSIMVGLQLTPEELAWNRSQRAKEQQ
jgi:hypothetical protein